MIPLKKQSSLAGCNASFWKFFFRMPMDVFSRLTSWSDYNAQAFLQDLCIVFFMSWNSSCILCEVSFVRCCLLIDLLIRLWSILASCHRQRIRGCCHFIGTLIHLCKVLNKLSFHDGELLFVLAVEQHELHHKFHLDDPLLGKTCKFAKEFELQQHGIQIPESKVEEAAPTSV